MARVRLNSILSTMIAGSMLVGSTAAVAATPAAPVQVSPWATLTALTAGAPAATLCGTAATAAAAGQTPAVGCVLPVMDTPPPVAAAAPPMVPPPVAMPAVGAPVGYAVSPLFLALGVLAAGAFVYFIAADHHHEISPR